MDPNSSVGMKQCKLWRKGSNPSLKSVRYFQACPLLMIRPLHFIESSFEIHWALPSSSYIHWELLWEDHRWQHLYTLRISYRAYHRMAEEEDGGRYKLTNSVAYSCRPSPGENIFSQNGTVMDNKIGILSRKYNFFSANFCSKRLFFLPSFGRIFPTVHVDRACAGGPWPMIQPIFMHL